MARGRKGVHNKQGKNLWERAYLIVLGEETVVVVVAKKGSREQRKWGRDRDRVECMDEGILQGVEGEGVGGAVRVGEGEDKFDAETGGSFDGTCVVVDGRGYHGHRLCSDRSLRVR